MKPRLVKYWLRLIKPLLGLDINIKGSYGSNEPLDVVIPAISKDIDVLPHTIEFLRKNLNHPIKTVYIVAPAGDKSLKALVNKLNCTFIDEAGVVPITKASIDYHPGGNDRSGWLFQQLIKLNADSFTSTDNILVLDSDTVLVRPQVVIKDAEPIFNHSDEHHLPYYEMDTRLTGNKCHYPLSFVSHYMVLNRGELKKLRSKIEGRHNLSWYDSIIKNIDKNEASGFSEYETYGNYYTYSSGNKCHHEYWFNMSFSRQKLYEVNRLATECAKKYKSISFHSYNMKAEK